MYLEHIEGYTSLLS